MTTSPLRRYIFRHHNMFIKYINKFKNRLYKQNYNRKDLNELYPCDLRLILEYGETITGLTIIDLTQGKK